MFPTVAVARQPVHQTLRPLNPVPLLVIPIRCMFPTGLADKPLAAQMLQRRELVPQLAVNRQARCQTAVAEQPIVRPPQLVMLPQL